MAKVVIKVNRKGNVVVEALHEGNQCEYDPNVKQAEKFLKDRAGYIEVTPVTQEQREKLKEKQP